MQAIKLEDKNFHSDGKPKGLILAVSAPSGTGKTTLCNMLLKEFKDIKPSVSYTTRAKRQGEKNGVSYHFINDAEFDKMVEGNEFIEWANVFGKRYGTAYKSVFNSNRSFDILLEIDVQGVENLIKIYRNSRNSKDINDIDIGIGAAGKPFNISRLVNVFIAPPSYKDLSIRLKNRGSMDDKEAEKRLSAASEEISKSRIYDYIITNDNLDEAYLKLKSIVIAERCRNLEKI